MAKGLIFDDSRFMRRIIREAVQGGGHEVVGEAENGNDALTLYEEKNPDFVTMDITMFGTDGLMAIADITRKNPDAKIIVVSALSENTLNKYGEKINARAFITKPFDKDEMIGTINRVLSE